MFRAAVTKEPRKELLEARVKQMQGGGGVQRVAEHARRAPAEQVEAALGSCVEQLHRDVPHAPARGARPRGDPAVQALVCQRRAAVVQAGQRERRRGRVPEGQHLPRRRPHSGGAGLARHGARKRVALAPSCSGHGAAAAAAAAAAAPAVLRAAAHLAAAVCRYLYEKTLVDGDNQQQIEERCHLW